MFFRVSESSSLGLLFTLLCCVRGGALEFRFWGFIALCVRFWAEKFGSGFLRLARGGLIIPGLRVSGCPEPPKPLN